MNRNRAPAVTSTHGPRALFVTVILVLGALFAVMRLVRESSTVSLPVATQSQQPMSLPLINAALAPYQQGLEQTRRPVLRIDLQDFPEDEPRASKVGGSAWWPRGEARPLSADRAAMVLLAQINFAELPASDAYPANGLLQFFITPDDFYGANFNGDYTPEALSQQRNFRVTYWPDIGGPSQTLPARVGEDFPTPQRPDQPRRMRFTKDGELLSSSDYRFNKLLGGDAYAMLDAWAKEHGHDTQLIDDIYLQLERAGHKFGDYPYFTQSDPRTDGPWEPLLQLDSDDHMMWGDIGGGGFFIDTADLARGDFSRVMCNWDCH